MKINKPIHTHWHRGADGATTVAPYTGLISLKVGRCQRDYYPATKRYKHRQSPTSTNQVAGFFAAAQEERSQPNPTTYPPASAVVRHGWAPQS